MCHFSQGPLETCSATPLSSQTTRKSDLLKTAWGKAGPVTSLNILPFICLFIFTTTSNKRWRTKVSQTESRRSRRRHKEKQWKRINAIKVKDPDPAPKPSFIYHRCLHTGIRTQGPKSLSQSLQQLSNQTACSIFLSDTTQWRIARRGDGYRCKAAIHYEIFGCSPSWQRARPLASVISPMSANGSRERESELTRSRWFQWVYDPLVYVRH